MELQALEPDAALCANALEVCEVQPTALQLAALPRRTLDCATAQLRRVGDILRSSKRDLQQVALKKDGQA